MPTLKKKFLIWLCPIVILLSGCANDRIRLLGYDLSGFFGTHPDYVTVQKGDTLYSISRRYNVPIREMIETNNLRPPYTLTIGRTLRLPDARYHIVQKGDTVYNISKRYNVDMSSLSRVNNIDAPYTLKIGQKLILPGSVVTTVQPTHYVSNSKPTQKTASKWSASKKKSTVSSAKKTTSRSSSAKVQKRNAKFDWPVKGKVISKFGPIAKGRNNDGINIQAPLGTAVKAADAGTIAYAGNELRGFGNLILLKHSGGWITAYAHNDRLLVKKGQKVRRGEKIATVGATGGVSTPQLHFEIRAGKKAVNPQSYLK